MMCEIPAWEPCSSTEPTWTQPCTETSGQLGSSLRRTFKPLERKCEVTPRRGVKDRSPSLDSGRNKCFRRLHAGDRANFSHHHVGHGRHIRGLNVSHEVPASKHRGK